MNAKTLLRLEGAGLAMTSIIALIFVFEYTSTSWSWWYLFYLVWPDFAIIAYLYSSKFGLWIYNIFHTSFIPYIGISFGVMCIYFSNFGYGIIVFSLFWLVHIGVDRFFGFGLKTNEDDFHQTHLGFFGKSSHK